MDKLIALSFGGGQDSATILTRELFTEHKLGINVVVFSDTGNEHPHTYATVARFQALCEERGLPFFWLTPDLGYHGETWTSLTAQWERNGNIGSKCFAKVCTDKLKITPIYKWLNAWVADRLGEPVQDRGKKNILSWLEQHGQIDMIIGIAKGEEKRLGGEFPAKWQQRAINRVYPLVDWGWDRNDCQAFLESHADVIGKVWPSNCMFCHFQSPQELLWLYRNHPVRFQEWVAHEARKIEKWSHVKDNRGVYGSKLLPVKLIEAQEEFGHMTDAELDDHKYSHGCAITNAY